MTATVEWRFFPFVAASVPDGLPEGCAALLYTSVTVGTRRSLSEWDDEAKQAPRPLVRWLVALVAIAIVVVVVPIASATQWLACDVAGSEACGRQELATAQLVVALMGVSAALAVVAQAWRGRRTLFAWLAIEALIYFVWALLADAAVHGWDDLKFFPPG